MNQHKDFETKVKSLIKNKGLVIAHIYQHQIIIIMNVI